MELPTEFEQARQERLNWLRESPLADLQSALEPHFQPSYRLVAAPHCSIDHPVGITKFGGEPDLPDDFEWPRWQGEALMRRDLLPGLVPPPPPEGYPLDFLAQINLTQLNTSIDLLPKSGLLSFFYDAEIQADGTFPEDAGSFRIFYFPQDPTTFHRKTRPYSEHDRFFFPECPVEVLRDVTFPNPLRVPELAAKITEENEDMIVDAWENLGGNRFWGHPQDVRVHDDMALLCECVTHGVSFPAEAVLDSRLPYWKANESNWRLLLQLDSDDTASWLWGECGRLYFWVRESDLQQGIYDRGWMVLENG